MSDLLETLDPRFRPYAERFILHLRNHGYSVFVTSTYRSNKVQRGLYRDYLAGRRKLPAAPPGQSSHQRGLAFDALVNDYNPDLPLSSPTAAGQRLAGAIWERLGGRWGGRFSHPPDPVHFEARSG